MMPNSVFAYLVFFLIALLSLSLIVAYLVKEQRKRMQLLGLQWLQALRFLLMRVQKHRGLSTYYLSGNWDVESELIELKEQISQDIKAIAQLGEWITAHEDWQGITRHWARLGGTSESLGFPKSFSQHCKLIANILELLDTVAEQHQINNLTINRQSYALWHEFLWIGELIGQCRALGVRILGLRSQNQQLEKHKRQVEKALREIALLLDHPFPKQRVSTQEIASIHSFIEFVDHNLIQNSGIISTNEYFHQATQTIAVIYECFDREMQNLHRKIAVGL